jgi:hypothetical protein
MKTFRLPSSFIESKLPELPAAAQSVLFALLWHTDKSFKPVWPSISRLQKMTGIKSDRTIRTHITTLERHKIISKTNVKCSRSTKHGISYDIEQSVYTFNMSFWIQRDIESKRAKPDDFISELAEVTVAEKTVQAVFDRLPYNLKQWLQHMDFTGTYNGILHFKQKQALPKEFVREQFRKEGLKIVVAS